MIREVKTRIQTIDKIVLEYLKESKIDEECRKIMEKVMKSIEKTLKMKLATLTKMRDIELLESFINYPTMFIIVEDDH